MGLGVDSLPIRGKNCLEMSTVMKMLSRAEELIKSVQGYRHLRDDLGRTVIS